MGLDPEGLYIVKLSMRVSRTIQNVPMLPKMTKQQLEAMEREFRNTMKSLHGLSGVYYSLGTIPKDVKRILNKDDLMFDNDDKFMKSAGIHKHWPTGSVSNPVYTDTGIPVFGTPNTDTGKNLPVFAGIENVLKMATFDQTYYLLRKNYWQYSPYLLCVYLQTS
jgi:hypothetical protein